MFKDMDLSCSKYEFEIIAVGPYEPSRYLLDQRKNLKYIRDFGSPSRCLQIGGLVAEGEFFAWCSDDCRIESSAFDLAIEFFENNLTDKDGMTMLYSEGENFTGVQHEDKSYWIAHTHPDLRFIGVNKDWKIAPVFMYKTKTFYEFGGIDCNFEHVNMNTHDLAFAIQASGGKIVESPTRVYKFNWNPNPYRQEYQPIFLAFIQNDRPRLQALYQNPSAALDRVKNYNNWKEQEPVWKRRFQ
jgi:hypothetical protein